MPILNVIWCRDDAIFILKGNMMCSYRKNILFRACLLIMGIFVCMATYATNVPNAGWGWNAPGVTVTEPNVWGRPNVMVVDPVTGKDIYAPNPQRCFTTTQCASNGRCMQRQICN